MKGIQYLGSRWGISKKRADKVLISIRRKETGKLSGTWFILHCLKLLYLDEWLRP